MVKNKQLIFKSSLIVFACLMISVSIYGWKVSRTIDDSIGSTKQYTDQPLMEKPKKIGLLEFPIWSSFYGKSVDARRVKALVEKIEKRNLDVSNYNKYRNDTYNYEIEYPNRWYIDTTSSDKGFTVRGPIEDNDYMGGDTAFSNYEKRHYTYEEDRPEDLQLISLVVWRSSEEESIVDFMDSKAFLGITDLYPITTKCGIQGVQVLSNDMYYQPEVDKIFGIATFFRQNDKLFYIGTGNGGSHGLSEADLRFYIQLVQSFCFTED